MAAGRLIFPGMMPALDLNGDPVPGARAYFYANGSTTLAPVYVDNTLTSQLSNPVVADGVGVWPAMWANTATLYTVALTDADGAPLPSATWSAVSAPIDATLASVALAESAKAAAEAAEAAAQTAETGAEAAETGAQAIATQLGSLSAAITSAQTSATGAAASAVAAAASAVQAALFDPSLYVTHVAGLGGNVSAAALKAALGMTTADLTDYAAEKTALHAFSIAAALAL